MNNNQIPFQPLLLDSCFFCMCWERLKSLETVFIWCLITVLGHSLSSLHRGPGSLVRPRSGIQECDVKGLCIASQGTVCFNQTCSALEKLKGQRMIRCRIDALHKQVGGQRHCKLYLPFSGWHIDNSYYRFPLKRVKIPKESPNSSRIFCTLDLTLRSRCVSWKNFQSSSILAGFLLMGNLSVRVCSPYILFNF